MNPYFTVREAIHAASSLLITSHVRPDGDAVGSVLGLKLMLENQGKDVVAYLSELPFRYRFLPGENLKTGSGLPSGRYDLLVALDCGNEQRLPWPKTPVTAQKMINIDHHADNSRFGDVNLVVPEASSTGEILFMLSKEAGWGLSRETAVCLYTAILTDTGGFQYENTTPRTHRIAAELIECGVEPDLISERALRERTRLGLELLAAALNTHHTELGGRLAWMVVHHDVLKQGGRDVLEDLINIIRDVSGVEVAVLFTEEAHDLVRVSFRSKRGGPNVREIAALFGGGGHARAAGCVVENDLSRAKQTVLDGVRATLSGGDRT